MSAPTDPFELTGAAPSATVSLSRGRENVATIATLRLANGHCEHVRVRNVSEGGLMAELSAPLEIDQPVEVEVPGLGWIKSRIAWQTAGRTGIAFDELIDPREVTRSPA